METAPQDSVTTNSLFNIRHNWDYLKNRPAFQEPLIDGIRAIAVMWVVIVHVFVIHLGIFPAEVAKIWARPPLSWIVNSTQGVDLFFVISGFLIGSILFEEMRKSGDLRIARFYVRRFMRLNPVYAVAMLLGIYFMHNLPHYPRWGKAQYAWANLLCINNFMPIVKQYMDWCWALAIEDQFYLLLPVFILLFIRFGKGRFRILVFLMVLSMTIRFAVIHLSGIGPPFRYATDLPSFRVFDVLYDKPWMRFGGLLAGVAGAYLKCYFLPQVRRFFARTPIITALSLVCLAFMAHIITTGAGSVFFYRIPHLARELWWALHRDVFSMCLMFLILAAIYTPRLFGGWLYRFLSWKGFYPIAQLSFSIYLMHEMLFFWIFPKLGPRLAKHVGALEAMTIDIVVGLAMTLLFAVTLYVTIERPCMRMRSTPPVLRFIQRLEWRKRLTPADARTIDSKGRDTESAIV